MSASPLAPLQRAARRRATAIACALAGPPLLALIALAARLGGTAAALLLAAASALVLAAWLTRRRSAIDARWVARRLDAAEPALEDSSALLAMPEHALAPLARMQQARLRQRIAALQADIRPRWPLRALAASTLLALGLLGFAAHWPRADAPRERAATASAPSPPTRTAITRVALVIAPPAYTRLAPRTHATLDAEAAQGSTLRWRLRFDPQPTAVTLRFHDGSELALRRDGADWSGEHRLDESLLYRVVPHGVPPAADDALHRLDATPDHAPALRVLQPTQTLTVLDEARPQWQLAFEAEDDYGIAAAELAVTLAQGSGENIAVRESIVALQPQDAPDASMAPPRSARYAHVLDLAALGFARGDDLIVRLRVRDNREPEANIARSAAFILRWPAAAGEDSAALEGIVQRTLPAYFRSQRQIILDAEALLAETPRPVQDRFLARSDAIGVDQRVLRLRYGQFLGEESEGAQSGAAAHEPAHAGDGHADDGDGTHAHDDDGAPARFGEAGDVVAEYGHVHDIEEAATLLDPRTKELLRAALGEMWQSELHLRQGDPASALPYAYRALDYVKQVQQSTRIYLARVGLEIRMPEESRRLGGDREGVTDRVDAFAPATRDAAPLAALLPALDGAATPDWDAAERWIATHRARLPDALGLLAALDRARREPDCRDCREQLRALLWSALPVPPAAVVPRPAPDARGAAWLDALVPGEVDR